MRRIECPFCEHQEPQLDGGWGWPFILTHIAHHHPDAINGYQSVLDGYTCCCGHRADYMKMAEHIEQIGADGLKEHFTLGILRSM